jgi:hypothetical protein
MKSSDWKEMGTGSKYKMNALRLALRFSLTTLSLALDEFAQAACKFGFLDTLVITGHLVCVFPSRGRGSISRKE